MDTKTLLKTYVDTFGLENVVIITDNQHMHSNHEGKCLMIDWNNGVVHSIRSRQDKTGRHDNKFFYCESFVFDQIEFISANSSPKEVKPFLDYLENDNVITVEERKAIVTNLQNDFKFAIGYGVDGTSYIPVDKDNNPLTIDELNSINNGSKRNDVNNNKL